MACAAQIGLVSRHHFRDHTADGLVIIVGRFHEAAQLPEKHLAVHGNGCTDMDQVVGGLLQAEASIFEYAFKLGMQIAIETLSKDI